MSSPGEADSFEFSARNPTEYAPTLFGNGYLLGSTVWNGTAASPATLAGLYDHLQEHSYTYQALIPSWNEIDYWNGFHWLNGLPPRDANLNGYLQTLDMYRGILTTRYEWQDSNRATRVEVSAFTCRQDGHIGVVQIKVTPDYGVEAGPVTFSFPLGGAAESRFSWEGAQLPGALAIEKVEEDSDGRGFVAVSKTRDGKVPVAQAVRVSLATNVLPGEVLLGLSPDLKRPCLNVKFIVRQGQTYTFTKFVAVASRESEARTIVRQAETTGYEAVLAKHKQAWKELWLTDILIRGDVEAQRAVHAAMFYLLSNLRRDVSASIPAVALPSRAYLGRIWWDADTFVFPGLLVLHPDLARTLVDYRCARLPEAKRNAERQGYRGALFPMESAETGQEEAPEWSSEIHIAGDVALAQWRYFLATGDVKWLRERGYPVLREVADFWVSRVTHDTSKDRYEIRSVTGPNEAIVHVDNDSYTNAAASRTLQLAAEAARLVGEIPNPDWARIAPKIFIPFDERKGCHLEHAGDDKGKYAHALILLTYPLGLDFPGSVKRKDLDVCLANFGKPGYEVGMLGNFYSVVASELGDRDLAYRLFLSTLRSYAKPPFYAMSETPANNRFVFLTAEGAFLQQVIFGFTGLRFSDNGLTRKYPPVLPSAWQSLELRRINIKGKTFDLRIEQGGKVTMSPAAPGR